MAAANDSGIFRWVCLIVAILFGGTLLYLVWDLKRDVTQSLESAKNTIQEANKTVAVVNEKLPQIVDEVKRGTETLSGVAEDVELLKSLAGIQNEQKRGVRGLALYANEIQQVLADCAEQQEAVIFIEEIFGSDLVEKEPMDEFLVGLSKEMVAVILPLAKSKQEVLYRVCHSGLPRRKPFFIKIGDAEPVALEEFIQANHPESAELPAYK